MSTLKPIPEDEHAVTPEWHLLKPIPLRNMRPST
jgi:hypothetical protein